MGAQFRSRFVFMLLSTMDQTFDLEWHYNEAHHGKGPMDGVGGTIKNLVFRGVKSGKVFVRNPKEFVKAANEIVPSQTIEDLALPLFGIHHKSTIHGEINSTVELQGSQFCLKLYHGSYFLVVSNNPFYNLRIRWRARVYMGSQIPD